MVELDRHEAHGSRARLGDSHSPLFRSADLLYRPSLIFSPVWMLASENLGTQSLLDRHKDRRPRPQRNVDYRLGIPIVVCSDPRLYGTHLQIPADIGYATPSTADAR
jgi:hypothetical protein